jgi:hypothetical protein
MKSNHTFEISKRPASIISGVISISFTGAPVGLESSSIPTSESVSIAFFLSQVYNCSIFTMILSAVAVIQIKFLVRAEGIATKTAQAAKESAEAASDSVRAFIDTERGRMFVGEITLTKKDGNDPQPTIDYRFINAGRSTVIVLQVSIERELIGLELSRDVTYDPTKVYDGIIAIGPDASIGKKTTPVFLPPCPPFSTPLTADDYANIAAKKARILVKGFIRYRTAFDDVYRRNFAVVYGGMDYFSDVAIPGYNEECREPKPK